MHRGVKMIYFACKNIEIKDLITCTFAMNKTDYKLFTFLLEQDEHLTTNEISEAMDLDRSSIQKSIKRLVEKDIVMRNQENLDKGGYIFSYKVKDKDVIKKKIRETIKKWNEKVEHEISRW